MNYDLLSELIRELGPKMKKYSGVHISTMLGGIPVKPGGTRVKEGSLVENIKFTVQKSVGENNLPLLLSFYNDGTILVSLMAEDGGLYEGYGYNDEISYAYYDKEAVDTVNRLVMENAEKLKNEKYPVSLYNIPNIEMPNFKKFAYRFGISPDYEEDNYTFIHENIPNIIDGIEEAKERLEESKLYR